MNTKTKFKNMWTSTARKANRIAIAPLALPNWTKVLRLGPIPKVSVKDLMEVKCVFKSLLAGLLFEMKF